MAVPQMNPLDPAYKTDAEQSRQLRIYNLLLEAVTYAILAVMMMVVLLLCGCGNYHAPRGSYSSSGEDAAAAALMGVGAFSSGWRSARQPMVTCMRSGTITLCN